MNLHAIELSEHCSVMIDEASFGVSQGGFSIAISFYFSFYFFLLLVFFN